MSPQIQWFLLFLFFIVLFVLIYFKFLPERVDTIFINARFHTMDAQNSISEAIAINGDKIVGVGKRKYIERKFKPKNKVDLAGKTVLPGLIDAHCHLFGLGLARLSVDLVGTRSEVEVVKKVADYISKIKDDRWIRGRGWDQNNWKTKSFPTNKLLNKVAENNPVYLTRIDGHACWVNKKAMEIAGVTKQTLDPPGGKIIRDNDGEPTGIFVDGAMELIYNFVPQPNEREMRDAIALASNECLSFGLTSVHEMGVDEKQIELYKTMINENDFPLRVYAAVDGPGELWEKMKTKGKIIGYGKNKLTIRTLKLYMDGALGSRGAALIEPYSDDPANRGLTVISEKNFFNFVDESLKNGFQVSTHAIGDRANHICLNGYESALKANQLKDSRLRIEHAQVLLEDDIPRFKKLGVIPSMQPTHCTSDMYWAEARLGPKRIQNAYAWRSLLKTGVIISGGSDFPVESPNPFLGIYAAITRKDIEGRPSRIDDITKYFNLSEEGNITQEKDIDGWYGKQKMTREDAVRSFTVWSAYSAFEENLKGSLERGKLADFIVISADIFECPVNEIPLIKVKKTIIGGKVVFEQ